MQECACARGGVSSGASIAVVGWYRDRGDSGRTAESSHRLGSAAWNHVVLRGISYAWKQAKEVYVQRGARGGLRTHCGCARKGAALARGGPLCRSSLHGRWPPFFVSRFFKTLQSLYDKGQPATIVLRTYGSDADDVIAAINAFAAGKHLPQFPGGEAFRIDPDTSSYIGRYSADDGSFYLQRTSDGKRITSEAGVIDVIEGGQDAPLMAIVAIQDDYEWWSSHGCAPSAGKPLWVHSNSNATTTSSSRPLHIFFDDNIKNNPSDSIVAVRTVAASKSPLIFEPLDGEATLALHGKNLFRCPTLKPILDDRWFLDRIDEAIMNIESS